MIIFKYFPSAVREPNISKSACHEIVLEDLGKRTLHARLIPCSLGQEQKEDHAAIFVDLLETAMKDDTFYPSILVEQYENKQRQGTGWRGTNSPASKKPCAQPLETKTMLSTFFKCKGVVHKEFVLQGQTKQKCTAPCM